MPTRRDFIAAALAAPLAAASPGRAVPAAPTPRFHLVDGWVLTDADLAVAGLHVR